MCKGSVDPYGHHRESRCAGWKCQPIPPPIMRPGKLVQIKKFPEKKEKILSPEFRFATMMGFVPSQLIIKAILTESLPHSIALIQGKTSARYANSKETFEAMKALISCRRRDLLNPHGPNGGYSCFLRPRITSSMTSAISGFLTGYLGSAQDHRIPWGHPGPIRRF